MSRMRTRRTAMNQPEFDHYSGSYDELLRDPIRGRFAKGNSGFFHTRKCDLIREYLRTRGFVSHRMRYLDVGCGRGELVSLLRSDFEYVAGCDPSDGMLCFADGIDTRVQQNPDVIPFGTAEFDFVSAVCVYHHVPPQGRLSLAQEIYRVLRPGGVLCIIEHNPYNPITRLIVSRTPIDAQAILVRPADARKLLSAAGFRHEVLSYFLFFPERLYAQGASRLETLLRSVPLGGQYAMFGRKGSSHT